MKDYSHAQALKKAEAEKERVASEARAAIRIEEDRLMRERTRLETLAHDKMVEEDKDG